MSAAKPRLLYTNRHQGEIRTEGLDQLLPPEHPARDVWAFVESLDLSDLRAQVRSVPGHPGAPAIDPRLLLAVWLQATADGVGSSRVLAALCDDHLAYRWLCGGVPVGYHTLADFRTGHGDVLDRLLTETVAVLLHEGLIDLRRVAQDGLRVRAAAGSGSFRRGPTIERCLAAARDQVEALRAQAGDDAGAAGRRAQAETKKRTGPARPGRHAARPRRGRFLHKLPAGGVHPPRRVAHPQAGGRHAGLVGVVSVRPQRLSAKGLERPDADRRRRVRPRPRRTGR